MSIHVSSAGLFGVEAAGTDIEVEVSGGLPTFIVVGLPDAPVRESRDRVRAAMRACRLPLPKGRVTINLAPARRRRGGSSFDLPIAIGVAAAVRATDDEARDLIPAMPRLADHALVGELGLDGGLRPVTGAIALAEAIRDLGIPGLILPRANAPEAALVAGIDAIGVGSLAEALGFLAGELEIAPTRGEPERWLEQDGARRTAELGLDLGEVRGQDRAKRLIAASVAGGHHALLIGSPGTGKTMLCRRAETILPPLTLDEALEATRVHSVAGLLPASRPLIDRRPFRAPHHGISTAALVGGGPGPRPGEIALASSGILFLDEIAEFDRAALEALRQPLEDGRITVSRARSIATFPARMTLLAAMNPCPCGWFGSRRVCRCARPAVMRYQARLSGPLLDRFDGLLFLEPPRLGDGGPFEVGNEPSLGTTELRAAVDRAVAMQLERFEGAGVATRRNVAMTHRQTEQLVALDADAKQLLGRTYRKGRLTARGVARVRRLARTLADLDGRLEVEAAHVAEALAVRPRPLAQVDLGRAGANAVSVRA